MKPTFFARYSLLVLMIVMFLVPFALRGARFSIQGIKNDIKDWLPSDFEETKELVWFARHFAGEQFVIVTWPGCTEDDPRFKLLVGKLRAELAPPASAGDKKQADKQPADKQNPQVASSGGPAVNGPSDNNSKTVEDVAAKEEKNAANAPNADDLDDLLAARKSRLTPEEQQQAEVLRARALGDRLGLYTVSQYYQNWGGKQEKWLRGDGALWYFITPDGDLYRWNGNNNLPSYLYRRAERLLTGRNSAEGELLATFGTPSTSEKSNLFYADPRKLTARLFKSVKSGPQILEELASPGGPLWPRGASYSEEDKPDVAREWAYERLTGALFGPQPPTGFGWTADEFVETIGREQAKRLPHDWRTQFDAFIDKLVERKYHGDRQGLLDAKTTKRVQHWFAVCRELGVEPPPPQTAVMVTLSEVGKRNLARVVGRPLMGKTRGKLLDLAIGECNISPDELKMGGPPVDNVAIDEEGTVTLVNLISYSALIGFVLAYLSFRSIKVTMMVFFVGGVSAITSLSLVWWSSVLWPDSPYSTVDAILLSMPSLIYVLGLSGAVHIVNYYREAAQQHGAAGAPERAVMHGWWPCTLAAFTTALGLISLCTSNILPIRKFGLFSAVGTMATLALLFSFLPAALQMWSPGYDKRREGDGPAPGERLHNLVLRFWDGVGRWIVGRHWLVTAGCVLVMAVFGYGLLKVNTSVQLLKLFDGDAKIIKDYEWLETHLGKLVPMELIVKVDHEAMLPSTRELAQLSERDARNPELERYQLNFLERLEACENVGREVERQFGEEGTGVVGRGLRAGTFLIDLPGNEPPSLRSTRRAYEGPLEDSRPELLASDYVRLDKKDGSELWRISLRLGALNDVDYGQFVDELKKVVEPVLAAYRYRDHILYSIDQQHGNFAKGTVLVLGSAAPPRATDQVPAAKSSDAKDASKAAEGAGENDSGAKESDVAAGGEEAGKTAAENAQVNAASLDNSRQSKPDAASPGGEIDQTGIFARTLDGLLINAGLRSIQWHDPQNPAQIRFDTGKQTADVLAHFDCVVLANPDASYDLDFIKQHARNLIVATDHHFDPASAAPTAAKRDDTRVSCIYTGVVPIVYKAQRTLLESLVNSIALAFVMIAVVMMFLLRNGKLGPLNFMNPSAGLVSMLPNVFPIVIVFGAMGHLGVLIDIGTMMTASVAMGVAVDDTIHFLTWFRQGINEGLSRKQAICKAYGHVATAMTQTTLIGGLGLSVFALSTFTPTQGFGVMMLALLAIALVGDLIFLPALLAGPLGWFFEARRQPTLAAATATGSTENSADTLDAPGGQTPHSGRSASSRSQYVRRDDGHSRTGQ